MEENLKNRPDLTRYLRSNRNRFIEELREICRIPSVTGNGAALGETARFVADLLRTLGARVEILDFPGHPSVVYGEIGDGTRTLLVYNHYDVQPPDPLELWRAGPFSAAVEGGRLYARGASDNKGNLMARIHAVRAYLDCAGPLPLKVKFFVEGEEESGSEGLGDFVKAHADMLRADGCLWEGSWKETRERPIISCGVKGLCHVELVARGAKHDMHSSYASIVPNPAWRLVWALSTLLGRDYRIRIGGVAGLGDPGCGVGEDSLRQVDFDEDTFKEMHGLAGFVRDETGSRLVHSLLCEPTCTICGLRAGYTGEGMKTVLPSEAVAKLDFRLVPGMTPEGILPLLRGHLDSHGFGDIEIRYLGGLLPSATPRDEEIVTAAVRAFRDVGAVEPIVYPVAPWGGPLSDVCDALGMPSVAFGVSHAGSLDHAPNENIRLDDYFEGIRVMMEFMKIYSLDG